MIRLFLNQDDCWHHIFIIMINKDSMELTARAELLPFDEITHTLPKNPNYDQQPRNRYNEGFGGLLRTVQKQRQKYELSKKEKLYNLSKVGDLSFDFPEPKTHFLFVKFQIWDKKYGVIEPESTFMICWNVFMLVAIFFNFFETPVALFMTARVYEYQFNNSVPLAFNIIFLLGFVCDNLLVRFNLGFYKFGRLVREREEIFERYMKFQFWVDFIAWVTLFVYMVGHDPSLVYIKPVFYIKVVTFLKIDSEVEEWSNIYPVRHAVYRLGKTVIIIWLFTTWVSSVYFAIDYHFYQQKGYYYQTGQLWLTNSNTVDGLNMITSFPWYVWYEYAVYWSLQTSATVGYGNITPRNPQEVLYCNFIIVINTVFFAWYMNTIWEVIGELQEASQKYAQNWGDLKTLFKNQKIPREVNKRVADFLEEIWVEEEQDIVEEELTKMLSQNLQSELYLSVKGQFFRKIPFFCQQRGLAIENQNNVHFAKQFVYLLREENVGQGQVIYKLGDSNPCLYYLLKGKVQMAIPSLDLDIDVCVKENFGFEEFVSGQQRFVTATAFTFCRFWKIERSVLVQALRQYIPLYQKYCELRQQVILEGDVELGAFKCIKCNTYSHATRDCQEINSWRRNLKKQYFYKLKLVEQEGNAARVSKKRYSMGKVGKVLGLVYTKKIQCDQITSTAAYRLKYNIMHKQ